MENEKLKQFVETLNSCIDYNYETIYDVFNSSYNHITLDPIRDEICKCIICGLYQGSITLTNHLLEKSLKYCLEIKYAKENKKENAKVEDVFIEGVNKYDEFELGETINRACTQGLITKKEKKELISFKNIFRNPYSHANTDIFKDIFIMGKTVSTKDLEGGLDNFIEHCFDRKSDNEIPLKYLLNVQGLFQNKIAQRDCVPYFRKVDEIIRNMLLNLKK